MIWGAKLRTPEDGGARPSLDVGRSSARRDGALTAIAMSCYCCDCCYYYHYHSRHQCACAHHARPAPSHSLLSMALLQLPLPHPASSRPVSVQSTATGYCRQTSPSPSPCRPPACRQKHSCNTQALVGDPLCKPCHHLLFDSPTLSHVASPSFSPFEMLRLHFALLSLYPNANMLLSLEQQLDEYPLPRTYIHHHAKSTPLLVLLFPSSHLILSTIPATCRRQSLNLSCWARLHVSTALLSASLLPTAR